MMKKAILMLVVLALAIPAFAQGGIGGGRGQGGRGGAPMGERDGLLMDAMVILTDATGLTPLEVAQAVRAGSTLAELITANGKDVEVVKADALALVEDAVNQAVADGKITQERANVLLAAAPERLDNALNGTVRLGELREGFNNWMEGRREQAPRRPAVQLLSSVATETGLTVRQVRDAVSAGKSLEAVLTENGADVNAFIDKSLEQAITRIEAQVTAGKVSRTVADARIALWRAELADALARTWGQ
jgi:hypothetical protein